MKKYVRIDRELFVGVFNKFVVASFAQKQERSDSNDILGTYFRPRRAAELIHQNKVLNCWKGNLTFHSGQNRFH